MHQEIGDAPALLAGWALRTDSAQHHTRWIQSGASGRDSLFPAHFRLCVPTPRVVALCALQAVAASYRSFGPWETITVLPPRHQGPVEGGPTP